MNKHVTYRDVVLFILTLVATALLSVGTSVEGQSQPSNSTTFNSGDAWCDYTGSEPDDLRVMIDESFDAYWQIRGKGPNLPLTIGGGKRHYYQAEIKGPGRWKNLQIWTRQGQGDWEFYKDVSPSRIACKWHGRWSIQAIDVEERDENGNVTGWKPWVDINELRKGLINPDTQYRIYVNQDGIVVYGYDGNAWLAAAYSIDAIHDLPDNVTGDVLLTESADGMVKIFQHPNGWFSVLIGPLDEYGKMKSYQFLNVPMEMLCGYEYRQSDPSGTWTQIQDCIAYN